MSLALTGVGFSYGDRWVVRDVSCQFEPRAVTALVGSSGSGKSTLIAMIVGLLEPLEGSISYPPEMLEHDRLATTRVAWVMQSADLFPRRTALDNVALPLEVAGHSRPTSRDRAADALASVAMGEHAEHLAGRLSGGQRQRVAVARALANKPALVLADEPTGNLDEATADKVLAQFVELVRGAGSAAIIATHNERLARSMDRVVRLHEGRLA